MSKFRATIVVDLDPAPSSLSISEVAKKFAEKADSITGQFDASTGGYVHFSSLQVEAVHDG